MRYLGVVDTFNYFGELIYKSGYQIDNLRIKGGYDVNIGLSYNISKDLSKSVKGENIFSKGIKIPYKNYANGDYIALKNNHPTTIFTIQWSF